MSNLYTFGCSYTEDYNLSNSYLEYKKYRGGILPDVWPKILGDHLNKETHNFGKGGIGNLQIFMDFCHFCNHFKENDIVIVGWTRKTRFRWADNDKWIHLMGSDKDMNCITLKTHNEILVNRTNNLYIKEIYTLEKIMIEIASLKKFKIYFWSSDCDIIYKDKSENDIYLLNEYKKEFFEFTPFTLIKVENNQIPTIEYETNGEIKDNHLGEEGHKIQARLFLNHILKYA